jgi:Tol biopolymer transport system component/DNA-binding winged helix-turn-helix (wHTH) protein
MTPGPGGTNGRVNSQDAARPPAEPFGLGPWRVEPSLNRISGPAGVLQLEPKLMDLLVTLAARPNQVFSRDDLLNRVWGDVVVGEEVLTRGISELRRLLGDDPRTPSYIETIRKGGYRIVAERRAIPLSEIADIEGSGEREDGMAEVAAHPQRTGLRPWVRGGIVGVVILLCAVAGTWILRGGDDRSGKDEELWRPRPLTAYPGNEVTPALSPDGRLVAFSWTGPQDDNYDLYVLQIGDASPLRITEDPAVDIHPVWSPDGMRLAYIHDEGPGAEIRVVPALGGPSRRLMHCPLGLGGGFSWSPDGSSIVYATRPAEDRSTQLHLLDLATEETRALTGEAPLGRDDIEPEFSPDGCEIAFIRCHASGFRDLRVVPATGGDARCVRSGLLHVMGLDWSRDGRDLICSALLEGSFSLWRVNVATGEASWSSVVGEWIYTPSVGRNVDRLVYHCYRHERNIWRVRLGDRQAFEPVPVIVSTHWDTEPAISPDGGSLAFTSTRSGTLELWVTEADGTDPRQLTMFGGGLVARPRWSPDGKRIAFHANPSGFQELYVMEVDGGRPHRLACGFDNAILSDWSRDGRWLYFAAERDGQWDIWRLQPDGSSGSRASRVTAGGAIRGSECADGYFYYSRACQAGLWRVPLDATGRHDRSDGAEPPWLTDLPPAGSWSSWTVCQDQILLLVEEEEGPLLVRLDPASGQRAPLTRLPRFGSPEISLDQDCLTCYFTRTEQELGDLMLVEGFR